MEIIKIVGIGIVGAIIVTMLKNSKSEIAVFATIGTGIVILGMIISSISGVVSTISGIVTTTGINSTLFSGILKIVGIGYLTEYSVDVCEDLECKTIGNKLRLAGKTTIFVLAIPIITSLVELIVGIIQ